MTFSFARKVRRLELIFVEWQERGSKGGGALRLVTVGSSDLISSMGLLE